MFKILLVIVIIFVAINLYIDFRNKYNKGTLFEGMLPSGDTTYNKLSGTCIHNGKYKNLGRVAKNGGCRKKCDEDNDCVAYARKGWTGHDTCYTYQYCDEQQGATHGWNYFKRKNNTNIAYERKNIEDAYILPGEPLKSEKLIKQLCGQYSYMCSGYYKDKHNKYRAFFKLTNELKKSGMFPYTILLDNSNGQEVYYRNFSSPEEQSAAENGTNVVLQNALKNTKEELKKKYDKYQGWAKDISFMSPQKSPCDEEEYLKDLKDDEGYYFDPYKGKGWCRKIYSRNVSKVKAAYDAGNWTGEWSNGNVYLPKNKKTLEKEKEEEKKSQPHLDDPTEQISYYQGLTGSNKCKPGDSVIIDKEECKTAAKRLNIQSDWAGGANNPGNLKHCFVESGIARYNINQPDSNFSHPNMAPMCKHINAEAEKLINNMNSKSYLNKMLGKVADNITNSFYLNLEPRINTHSHDKNTPFSSGTKNWQVDALKNIDHLLEPKIHQNKGIPQPDNDKTKLKLSSENIQKNTQPKHAISGRTTNMLNKHKHSYYTDSYKPLDPKIGPAPFNSLLSF
jgi:hypothetical protein